MNLVIIYGPPAVGKLTTATRLSEITGYSAFHSHLAIDLVNSITPDGKGSEYSELLFKIMYEVIEFAWRKGQGGIIMTIAYTGSEKQKEILMKLKELVESNGGNACFVKLYTGLEELKRRVVNPSRDYYGKLISVDGLEEWMHQADYFSRVDFSDSYEVDNTEKAPQTVALDIKSHFSL